MGLSFDPDALSFPTGHFVGGRLVAAKGVIDMHRPSDGKSHAGCPSAMAITAVGSFGAESGDFPHQQRRAC